MFIGGLVLANLLSSKSSEWKERVWKAVQHIAECHLCITGKSSKQAKTGDVLLALNQLFH